MSFSPGFKECSSFQCSFPIWTVISNLHAFIFVSKRFIEDDTHLRKIFFPGLFEPRPRYLSVDVFLAGIDVYVGLVEQLASKDTLPGEEEQLKRRKVR